MDMQPGALGLDDLRAIGAGPVRLRLPEAGWHEIGESAAAVRRVAEAGTTVYGVNTGFGRLARQRIDANLVQELQRRLLLSHAAGVGPALPDAVVRRVLALKVNALAQAHSGVRPEVVQLLLDMLAADLLPVVPAQGSVGASGDLAPLAHLSLPLIGEGEACLGGEILPGAEALRRAGLRPVVLGPKEGLALLNGTQVSTALALTGLFAIADCFAAAVVSGALSVDAAMGSTTPFDPRIQALRGHPGQVAAAALYRDLLAGSAIRESHLDCDRVQDPYSLRCQPQVMGACLDQIRHAARILAVEANAVSDNPLVFAETGEVLSGGNFHAQPVAFAADNLALAAAEIGSMSERRLALLFDPAMNGGLPAFLIEDGGLNSGFMLVQVTAAALVAENRTLAAPASIDSIPTSANQEDHVSMATHAARRLLAMADNLAAIVACELLVAAQGVELRAPLATSPRLAAEIEAIRRISPPLRQDRSLAGDLRGLAARVLEGAYAGSVAAPVLDPVTI